MNPDFANTVTVTGYAVAFTAGVGVTVGAQRAYRWVLHVDLDAKRIDEEDAKALAALPDGWKFGRSQHRMHWRQDLSVTAADWATKLRAALDDLADMLRQARETLRQAREDGWGDLRDKWLGELAGPHGMPKLPLLELEPAPAGDIIDGEEADPLIEEPDGLPQFAAVAYERHPDPLMQTGMTGYTKKHADELLANLRAQLDGYARECNEAFDNLGQGTLQTAGAR